jgi:hypothetical protein
MNEILDDDQRRALEFVYASVRGGYRPTNDELNEWLMAPRPRPSERGPVLEAAEPGGIGLILTEWAKASERIRESVTLSLWGGVVRYGPDAPAEPFIDHLVRLRWLESEGGTLGITSLGRALLRSAAIDDEEHDGAESVVLGANNALAYPTFISHMVEAGDGLVVDPYTRVDQLLPVLQHTTITRLLVSESLSQSDRAGLTILVESGSYGRDFELRCAAKHVLHDRYIIGKSVAYTIGTSMGTIGGKYSTVLTPLPELAADAIRAHAEGWWAAAQVLAVHPPVDTDSALAAQSSRSTSEAEQP